MAVANIRTTTRQTYSQTAGARDVVGTDRAVLSVDDERICVTATRWHRLRQPVNTTVLTPATRRVRHTRQTRHVRRTQRSTSTHVRLQELHRDHVTLLSRVLKCSRPLQLHQ